MRKQLFTNLGLLFLLFTLSFCEQLKYGSGDANNQQTVITINSDTHLADGTIEYIFVKDSILGNVEPGVYKWKHGKMFFQRKIIPEDTLVGGKYKQMADSIAKSITKEFYKDTLNQK